MVIAIKATISLKNISGPDIRAFSYIFNQCSSTGHNNDSGRLSTPDFVSSSAPFGTLSFNVFFVCPFVHDFLFLLVLLVVVVVAVKSSVLLSLLLLLSTSIRASDPGAHKA